MDPGWWLKGVAIGFSIAAPVGPIGALCIRRTLSDGRAAGLATGLGAATADACYGAVAGFGLAVVAAALTEQQIWLRLLGGLFLLYLGARTFLARPSATAAPARGRDLLTTYATTFALTLTNPLTILSFAGVFAGLGLGAVANGYGAAAPLVAGVFCGSALWWLLLTGGLSLARSRVTPAGMRWVNRFSGVIILGAGALALLGLRG
jgi:threonine/homoserine/homoserine lactone efflux protein